MFHVERIQNFEASVALTLACVLNHVLLWKKKKNYKIQKETVRTMVELTDARIMIHLAFRSLGFCSTFC